MTSRGTSRGALDRLGLVCAILGPAAIAAAQDEMPISDEPGDAPVEAAAAEPSGDAPARDPLRLRVGGMGFYQGRADLKDGPGDVAISRAGAQVSFGFEPGERWSVTITTEYEFADYDFDDATETVPGGTQVDPLDPLNRFGFAGAVTFEIDDHWSVFGAVFANIAWERGAHVDDAWTPGGYGGVSYAFGRDLVVGFGLGISAQLEDDPWFFPVVVLRWQVSETLLVENERLGARATWSFAEDWALYGRCLYEFRDYRLDQDGTVLSGGVFRDTFVPLGVGVTWRPIEGLSASLEVGATVWQELEFRDDSDGGVSSTDVETAPYVYLGVQYRF